MNKPWYIVARERAKHLGITYQQIADHLDVVKSTVGHWLTGRNKPRLETIARIAAVLDCSVHTLIADDPYYLSDDTERAVIDELRHLDPEHQAQALAMLRAFATSVASQGTPRKL
jgi:transcriptional regulator with XRE-family HTH domain